MLLCRAASALWGLPELKGETAKQQWCLVVLVEILFEHKKPFFFFNLKTTLN